MSNLKHYLISAWHQQSWTYNRLASYATFVSSDCLVRSSDNLLLVKVHYLTVVIQAGENRAVILIHAEQLCLLDKQILHVTMLHLTILALNYHWDDISYLLCDNIVSSFFYNFIYNDSVELVTSVSPQWFDCSFMSLCRCNMSSTRLCLSENRQFWMADWVLSLLTYTRLRWRFIAFNELTWLSGVMFFRKSMYSSVWNWVISSVSASFGLNTCANKINYRSDEPQVLLCW